jgi:enamine deaminase RidA (YjgF/YER057c/UK114 family)
MTLPGVRSGSGGPFEDRWGYSRVVRVGPWALTAGCTATVDGTVQHAGDAHAQTLLALRIALDALAGVGLPPESVVSSRMYVTDMSQAEQVGTAHGAVFGAIRPVAAMIGVSALADPAMLVEVELQAYAG